MGETGVRIDSGGEGSAGVPENIELKVRCSAEELAEIQTRLTERRMPPLETIRQADVYFRVAAGRLKLRTIERADPDTSAELIHYQRADTSGARVSRYRRVPIATRAVPELQSALEGALGVLTVVRNVRSVALWRSTRIHLDEVEGLGRLVELETVLGDHQPENAGRAEFADVVEWLGLASMESIPGSYSDLTLLKGQHPRR